MSEDYEQKYREVLAEYKWIYSEYCKLRALMVYGGKN
jgi:hypothetical protein